MITSSRSVIEISARLYEALDSLAAAERRGMNLEDMRIAGMFTEAGAACEEWESRCNSLISIRTRVEQMLAQKRLALPSANRRPWYRLRRSDNS